MSTWMMRYTYVKAIGIAAILAILAGFIRGWV